MNQNSDLNIGSASERGTALVTVILVSFLLGTACIAMLTAVGASSKNNTDALDEYKAYYAAENGLQSTINVLRNDSSATYGYAVQYPLLDTKLTYTTRNGVSQVVVDDETGYSIYITDPDSSTISTTYSVDAQFLQADGITYSPTRVFSVTDSDGITTTTTLSYRSVSSTVVSQPMTSGTDFGAFQIQNSGAGTPPTLSDVSFVVNYRMSEPRSGVRSIRGTVKTDGSVTFNTYAASLMGSTISLCSDSSCSPAGTTFALALPSATTSLQSSPTYYGKMDAIDPYRLKVLATGYGPHGAVKRLEGVIQRNFFNDVSSAAAITMVGSSTDLVWNPGTAATLKILGEDSSNSGVSIPSVGVTDPNALGMITPPQNGTMSPPPAVVGDEVPDWQQTTTEMNDLVNRLYQTAQNAGQVIANGATIPDKPSEYSSGTGITFCDGDCTLKDTDGGILVVTGRLTLSGNPKFNGLILVTGYVDPHNGIYQGGGGNKLTLKGNIVIAPYNPDDLAAGFGSPYFYQNGGSGVFQDADIEANGTFDGTSAISNFMLGIAEK